MKWFIAIIFMFNVLMGSEYLPLTPSNTLENFASQGAGVQDSAYIRQSSTVTLTKDVHAKDGDWYTTQWQKYKLYFPAGTSSSSLAFICKPNASYRVHVTFIGENATINHNPATNDSYIVNTKQTNEFLVQNIKVIELDAAMINSSNGGWVYIDVAEDSANIPSYYGDVNPALSIAATSKIDNKSLYNSWKNSVNLLSDGRPEDVYAQMTVIDKVEPHATLTRTILMDAAVDPSIDKDGDGFSPSQGDCNDYNSAIYPGATEIANDGIDQNCDQVDLVDLTIVDQDKDGFTPKEGDCNDHNSAINPGETPIPNNGINDNCAPNPVYEYASLHPKSLLSDLSEKFETADNVIISKDVTIAKKLARDENGWYAPNGWQSYKLFLPKGADELKIDIASSDNSADFKVHSTFKANQNATINHVTPIAITTPISHKGTVEANSHNGGIELIYDSAYVDAEEGGYVYIDIANNPTSTLNPVVTASLFIKMSEHSTFDTWKQSVNVINDGFIQDGDPEDSVSSMTIIDKDSSEGSTNRTIQMSRGLTPWSVYANQVTSSSSASSSSSGSTSSECHFWEACYIDPSPSSSPTPSPKPSSSASYSSHSISTSGNECHFWEACYTNSTSNLSSNPSSSASYSSSSASSSGDECHFWEACHNDSSSSSSSSLAGEDVTIDKEVVKEALSGKTYQISGTFSHYDFDNVEDAFDWVYKDTIGYAQLRGNPATLNNVFGWKDITIDKELVANWYLFPLGDDIDGDGSKKFDWMIISADANDKQAYKLSGSTDKGTFRYSEIIDLDYTLSANRDSVTFAALRPGERESN